MSRARSYCFTLNNYNDDELATLREAGRSAKYLVMGLEVGESGTPHVQGYVVFQSAKTLSAAKATLGARCYLERARGTPEEASNYCKKDGSYEQFGTLPQQGKRNDLRAFLGAVDDNVRCPKVLRREHPEVCAKYPTYVRQILADSRPKPDTPDILLQLWQQACIDVIKAPTVDRKIHFVIDAEGGLGKSTFATYVESIFDNVQVMKPGQYKDMAFELDEDVKIFILDCPRSRCDIIQWHFLEDIKDGRVQSSKYESHTKRVKDVKVFVFSNEGVPQGKLSADRIDIIHEQ